MRDDNIYRYDEDDAIPIKRRKKTAQDRPTDYRSNTAAAQRNIQRSAPVRASAAAQNRAHQANVDRSTLRIPADKTAGTEKKLHPAREPFEGAERKTYPLRFESSNAASAPRREAAYQKSNPASRPAQNPQSARTAAADPARRYRANNLQKRTAPALQKKTNSVGKEKKSKYKKAFLIYVGVLVILSIFAIVHVSTVLNRFNSSDIEVRIADKLYAVKQAAAKGNIESEMSFNAVREKSALSDQALKVFETAVAEGSLRFEKPDLKTGDKTSGDLKTYYIFLNGFKIGKIDLKAAKEDTLGLIPPFITLPITEWEIVSCEAEDLSFELPDSCSVIQNGVRVEGTKSENEGFSTYFFSGDMKITDSIGNSIDYGAGTVNINEYTVKIRSDYKLFYGDTEIDPSKAIEKNMEDADIKINGIKLDMETVKEYASAFPKMSVYNLYLIDTGDEISVKDAEGRDVEFKQNGNNIKAYDLNIIYSDTLPDYLPGQIDPMKIAETWSLFMSQDLTGPSNGFATLAQYLVKDSYLYESMWKYANGIDITFTSDHTLDNPPFSNESVSNFAVFSDTFFACNITLDKPMNLANGTRYVDSIDSTFYFVYVDDSEDGIDNPHWAAAARID